MRKKNTSDRQKLKTKYTNQHKRTERRKKLKRDMKKNPNKYHKKKSDPGVPNSAPFKLALLDERDKYLDQKAQEKEKNRQKILKARQAMREKKPLDKKRKLTEVLNLKEAAKDDNSDDSDSDTEPPLDGPTAFPDDEMEIDLNSRPKKRKTNDGTAVPVEEMELDEEEMERRQAKREARFLVQKAKKEYKQFLYKHKESKNNPEADTPDARFHNWSDKVYYKQVKMVVEAADVLLEVIDARDPLGTRCSVLESIVRSRRSKKLVFVLNKADLIPKSNLQAWLKYFRAEGPTVAFKAATHKPKSIKKNVNRWVHIGEETLRTPSSMGGDVLMQLLKNYARSFKGMGIVVGVVGLPNVGKSSLINSLKKVKTCEVAPTPGSTKHLKEIKLDAKLHLIDSPGVVLPGENMNHVDAVLRNLVRQENIRNPVDAAAEIFNRSDSMKLALFYEVRKVETAGEFLANLARRCKKKGKTGLPDRDQAALRMIYDWNHGVLKYYTEPPQRAESEVTTSVVSKLSAAFELDTTATQKEEKFLSYMTEGRPSITIAMAASEPATSFIGLEELQNLTVDTEDNDASSNDKDSGAGDSEGDDSDAGNSVNDEAENGEEEMEDEGSDSFEENSAPENSDDEEE